jgi:heat shock protein HtpX
MKAILKRWGLFLTVNFLVLFVLGIILQLLKIKPSDIISLLIYCAIFGFAGSFISLFMSKPMAKASYRIIPITRENATGKALALYETIEEMAVYKHIKMPEIGIYPSPDNNAFATGANRNSSLIAFSSGIMENLNLDELAAVAGHEMTHITEGDMVTTTLLMGTLNTFVFFISNLLAILLSGGRSREEGFGRGTQIFFAIIIQNILMIFANIAICAYSRHREYAADAGSARLTSPVQMMIALEKISNKFVPPTKKDAYTIAKINYRGPATLFATHPPVEKRIERLRKMM